MSGFEKKVEVAGSVLREAVLRATGAKMPPAEAETEDGLPASAVDDDNANEERRRRRTKAAAGLDEVVGVVAQETGVATAAGSTADADAEHENAAAKQEDAVATEKSGRSGETGLATAAGSTADASAEHENAAAKQEDAVPRAHAAKLLARLPSLSSQQQRSSQLWLANNLLFLFTACFSPPTFHHTRMSSPSATGGRCADAQAVVARNSRIVEGALRCYFRGVYVTSDCSGGGGCGKDDSW